MRQENDHSLNGLLAMVLFGVFAACVLSVLLTGTDAYQRLTERDQASYESRTAAQYIATRVRQADCAGGVSAGTFGDSDALELWETVGESTYVTRVYCYDGWLRELFTDAGGDFAPEDGEKVLEADSLAVTLSSFGLLTAQITSADGTVQQVVLTLRSGRGEAAA